MIFRAVYLIGYFNSANQRVYTLGLVRITEEHIEIIREVDSSDNIISSAIISKDRVFYQHEVTTLGLATQEVR